MLISNETQAREILASLRKDYDFDTLRPFFREAEEGLLTELIGAEQVGKLGESALDEKQTKLQSMAKSVVVWSGYLDAFVSLTYNISKTGINRAIPKETEVLRRWEVDAILEDAAKKVDRVIERMMAFLEANPGDFEEWSESEQYKANYAYFIPTPRVLAAALPEVKSTYRLFLVLKNYFPRVERNTVKVIMGPLYEELQAKMKEATALSEQERAALVYAREYIAATTMVDAMPFLRVHFAADGIRLLQTLNNLHDQTAVNPEDLEKLRAELRKRAEQARDELRKYLNATASETVLTTYFNSSNYIAPSARTWSMPDNADRKSFRL